MGVGQALGLIGYSLDCIGLGLCTPDRVCIQMFIRAGQNTGMLFERPPLLLMMYATRCVYLELYPR